MKKSIFTLLGIIVLVLSSCAQKDTSIPINLKFKGEISKYYSVQNAFIKLEKKDNTITGPYYAATIAFDLIRNDVPFILDPSSFDYQGVATVGLPQPASAGQWCMFVKVENASHDNIGTCCGSASKLFEYYSNPGDVCHLTFEASFDDIWRKGTVEDCSLFLKGEQEFYFYLNGPLAENDY